MTIDAEARVVAAESEKKALLIRASAEAQVLSATLVYRLPTFLDAGAQSIFCSCMSRPCLIDSNVHSPSLSHGPIYSGSRHRGAVA